MLRSILERLPCGRRLLPAVCLFLLLAGLAAPAAGAEECGAACVGQPAPLYTLPALSGEKVSLKKVLDRKGVKAVILSFFAIWCDPCRLEIAALEKLVGRYSGRGLAAYLVATGTEHGEAELRDYLTAFKKPPPVLLDRFAVLPRRYDTGGRLPSLFLIDKAGVVRFRSSAFERSKGLSALEAVLRKLLEPAPPG